MATINRLMKFEIKIPKETWLMLRKPCPLQTDGRTDGWTDKVNPVYPPPTSLGRGIINIIPWYKLAIKYHNGKQLTSASPNDRQHYLTPLPFTQLLTIQTHPPDDIFQLILVMINTQVTALLLLIELHSFFKNKKSTVLKNNWTSCVTSEHGANITYLSEVRYVIVTEITLSHEVLIGCNIYQVVDIHVCRKWCIIWLASATCKNIIV